MVQANYRAGDFIPTARKGQFQGVRSLHRPLRGCACTTLPMGSCVQSTSQSELTPDHAGPLAERTG
jgi:hypothetical protein